MADEKGEYTGKVLAGLGADIIKVEPPEGNSTRRIGPFLDNDPHPDRSLHFWHYNFGKRGLTLDLLQHSDQARFLDLARQADIFLETTPKGYLETQGITFDTLRDANPGLIWVRLTAFGDDGPWSNFKGSDLVHLALGGVMMNTGYDPDPITKRYDLPPIAPQMFHAYHVAGQQTVIATIGALLYQQATGKGQFLSTSIHEAVSKNTETDMPSWIYQKQPYMRQTCRHAAATLTPRSLALTKDGRHIMARSLSPRPEALFEFLDAYGCADDLLDEKYKDAEYLRQPEVDRHINDVTHRFVIQCNFEGPWHEAQQRGQIWAPARKPEENLPDPQWAARDTYFEVEHPELAKSFTYIGAPWIDAQEPWRQGPRAPLLGENNGKTFNTKIELRDRVKEPHSFTKSERGKPFALNNVRILDFTWWLASGGGPRFLIGLGAEDIKVEWKGRWDLRYNCAMPDGGRAARDVAADPCPPAIIPTAANGGSPNQGGFFNDINPGKWGISLNMNHPKGKEIMRKLIQVVDVVAEGFSPEVMRKWGFGYEQMKEINPSIIYVQQSGMGQQGTYGKYRAVGPVAASLSGLTEMSGLPEPHPPVGIGYSFLDWFGAYNIATSMIAALYHREKTGHGTYIDASQVEIGIYLNSSSILNYTVNNKPWQRYGNRSPWKVAAPAGAYRCAGEDRWIAITCHDDNEWRAFCQVLGHPDWTKAPQFRNLELRLVNQDELDKRINETITDRDAFELMSLLQAAGVPAGVCQTAEDRYTSDPQLKHLQWLTELDHSEMGRWPIKEFPVKLSETPTFIGGRTNRASPCYGEDSDKIYTELLGMTTTELAKLREEDVI
ncbi:CoA transferase [Dehalococcoidia bacterium]|nr:CoA transferase [Dehalococcoidia bacterium]